MDLSDWCTEPLLLNNNWNSYGSKVLFPKRPSAVLIFHDLSQKSKTFGKWNCLINPNFTWVLKTPTYVITYIITITYVWYKYRIWNSKIWGISLKYYNIIDYIILYTEVGTMTIF